MPTRLSWSRATILVPNTNMTVGPYSTLSGLQPCNTNLAETSSMASNVIARPIYGTLGMEETSGHYIR